MREGLSQASGHAKVNSEVNAHTTAATAIGSLFVFCVRRTLLSSCASFVGLKHKQHLIAAVRSREGM